MKCGEGLVYTDTMNARIEKWYKSSGIRPVTDGVFEIVLDGKPLRTRSGLSCSVPSLDLAKAVADEWANVEGRVDFNNLPLTRLLFHAVETTPHARSQVEREIAAYAGTDLICFRAEQPQSLNQRQEELLEPVCQWTEEEFGIALARSTGIVARPQDPATIDTCLSRLQKCTAYQLAALNQMTRRAGSVFLALAVFYGHLSVEDAWARSRLEEAWQISRWGEDPEATAAAENAAAEFAVAARFLELLG